MIVCTRRAGPRLTPPNSASTRLAAPSRGDSADANMAAVTAPRLRNEGGPALCGQLLLYPATDYYMPDTPSYQENVERYELTRDTMKWFWDHYLSGASERGHAHASALRATDLSGSPPALVITVEYHPLRDEGELYAEKLKAAGVPVAISRYSGVNHGFMFWVGVVDRAGVAMDEACGWLRGIFAGPRYSPLYPTLNSVQPEHSCRTTKRIRLPHNPERSMTRTR
jgi:acetyl esterase